MKASCLAGLLAVVLALPAAAAADLKALHARARNSVVQLKNFNASGEEVSDGTGFIVQGGHIVTNRHVVAGASRMEAVLPDGKTLELPGVLVQDEAHDLAVLAAPAHSLPPLSLAASGEFEPGEPVVVLGNPLGFSSTLSDGIISAWRPKGLEDEPDAPKGPLLQITAAISPGSSGSPVMNMEGEVVGVAVAVYQGGQSLNFAVPAVSLRKVLAQVKPGRMEESYSAKGLALGPGILRNLGISALIFAGIFVAFRFMKN